MTRMKTEIPLILELFGKSNNFETPWGYRIIDSEGGIEIARASALFDTEHKYFTMRVSGESCGIPTNPIQLKGNDRIEETLYNHVKYIGEVLESNRILEDRTIFN